MRTMTVSMSGITPPSTTSTWPSTSYPIGFCQQCACRPCVCYRPTPQIIQVFPQPIDFGKRLTAEDVRRIVREEIERAAADEPSA